MASGPIEREVKLDAGVGFRLPDLTDVQPGVFVSTLPRVDLDAVYFDTADLRLARRGITLRYRRDGSNPDGESGWTLKLPADSGPLLARRELSFPGGSENVPDEATSLVRAYVRAAPLVTVARLRTRRDRAELSDGDGRRLAEIDDDEVSVLDRRRVAARFREVEVELADDAPGELLAAVLGRLRQAGAAPGEGRPKLFRALGAPPGEPDVTRPDVDESSPMADVVRASVADGVARLLRHDPGVRLGDDPEDVHQARVAARRLRSDLRTLSPLLDEEWGNALRDELEWLADALGEVRDADVLLDRLHRHARQLPAVDARATAALRRRLVAEREQARLALRDVLDDPRYITLLEALVEAAAEPRLAPELDPRPAGELLPELVRRPWRHLQRAVEVLGPEPGDDELHQVRIRAKRARYAAEAASAAVGKPARRLAKAVARLQGVLGDLQDAVVAERWLRDAAHSRGEALAAGQLVGTERAAQAACRASWAKAWKKASGKRLRGWLDAAS